MNSSSKKPAVLLTNDDGYDAPGLAALARALETWSDLYVVAPDREQSAAGHALTLRRPLRVVGTATGRYRVDGTPTDCVHLGIFNLTGGSAPDLVVSGVNRGLNLGDDVTYSGTVAGALEATLLQVPAMAVSAAIDENGNVDFAAAARIASKLAGQVLERGLPRGVFLNVNVPVAPKGIAITRQGTRAYRAAVVERIDPSGKPYFWIAGADTTPSGEPDGDHAAVAAGLVSVTPLHANLTHVPSLAKLRSWDPELP